MYLSKGISFVTGSVFLILISRSLGLEVGLWQLLMSYISISMVPRSIINFWTIRYSSRGYYTVNDAIKAMSLAILIGSIFYYFSVFTFTSLFRNLLDIVILGNLFLLMTYLSSMFSVIAFSRAPQVAGFSLTIFELSKMFLLVILYISKSVSILTIMMLLFFSRIVELAFVLVKYKNYIFTGERIDGYLWRKWIAASWVPLLIILPVYLPYTDKLVVSFITNSYEPIAYFSIAFSLAGLVSQTTSVVSVLYPKLLQSGNSNDIIITFKLTFLFSLPIMPLILVGAEQIIQIFGYEFVEASNIARILIFAEVLVLFDNIFNNILLGVEKVDMDINFKFRDIIKSFLFKVPVLNITAITVYVILIGIFLYFFNSSSPVFVAFIWSVIYVIYRLGLVLAKYTLSRDIEIEYSIPWGSILKYVFSAVVSSVVLFFLPKVSGEIRLLSFVELYTPYLLVYLFLYMTISVAIDDEARYLLKRVIETILKNGT